MGFNLFSFGSPQKKLERELNKRYERAVISALRNCDNEIIAGVIAFHAITHTYDSLKHDSTLMESCGLSHQEYLRAVDASFYREGPKYISNFNMMVNQKVSRDLDDVPPPSFYDF